MDSLIRCAEGHYYDSSKHSSCPFCGVQNLDIAIQKTMAKRPGTGEAAAADGKTVGIFKKKLGIDPVVGWLVAVKGPEKGKDFRLTAEKNFVGRSSSMDISLAGDNSVSRENHAIVSFNPKNATYRLYPGDSRGLVYLNDEEVIMPATLAPYDVIEVGQSKLVFIPLCGEHFTWDEEKEEEEK